MNTTERTSATAVSGSALSDGLGPLPESAQTAYVTDSVMRSHEVRGYTASQMRAYAAAAVAAERERCAKLCEAARPAGGRAWDVMQSACFDALTHVAAAIRA